MKNMIIIKFYDLYMWKKNICENAMNLRSTFDSRPFLLKQNLEVVFGDFILKLKNINKKFSWIMTLILKLEKTDCGCEKLYHKR